MPDHHHRESRGHCATLMIQAFFTGGFGATNSKNLVPQTARARQWAGEEFCLLPASSLSSSSLVPPPVVLGRLSFRRGAGRRHTLSVFPSGTTRRTLLSLTHPRPRGNAPPDTAAAQPDAADQSTLAWMLWVHRRVVEGAALVQRRRLEPRPALDPRPRLLPP